MVLNGEVSDWGDILSGLVQVSLLGPTPFLHFLNNLDVAMTARGEQTRSTLKKFADDKVGSSGGVSGRQSRIPGRSGQSPSMSRHLADAVQC